MSFLEKIKQALLPTAKITGGNLGDMTPQSGKVPDMVRFVEIDFNTTGNGVSLAYTKFGWQKVDDWNAAYALIENHMRTNRFPNSTSNPTTPRNFDSNNAIGFRDRTRVSLRAPTNDAAVDSEHSDTCLYVFRIGGNGGGSRTNWRFSRIFSPFTFGDKFPDLKNVFSDAQLLRLENNVIQINRPILDELPPGVFYDEARWACFLFDCKEARKLVPTLNNNFVLRFNIHVEVSDKNGNYIALIVDPDIGHPGGGYP